MSARKPSIRELADRIERALCAIDEAKTRARKLAAQYVAELNNSRRREWPHGKDGLQKMLHAVGCTKGRVGGWRNHYTAGDDGDPVMERLCHLGLTVRHRRHSSTYSVTERGARELREYGYAVAIDRETYESIMSVSPDKK